MAKELKLQLPPCNHCICCAKLVMCRETRFAKWLFLFASYQNNDHKDFVRDLSWSPSDNCLRTCGWDTQIIRHTTSMIEGPKDVLHKIEAMETNVIIKAGFNGIISVDIANDRVD